MKSITEKIDARSKRENPDDISKKNSSDRSNVLSNKTPEQNPFQSMTKKIKKWGQWFISQRIGLLLTVPVAGMLISLVSSYIYYIQTINNIPAADINEQQVILSISIHNFAEMVYDGQVEDQDKLLLFINEFDKNFETFENDRKKKHFTLRFAHLDIQNDIDKSRNLWNEIKPSLNLLVNEAVKEPMSSGDFDELESKLMKLTVALNNVVETFHLMDSELKKRNLIIVIVTSLLGLFIFFICLLLMKRYLNERRRTEKLLGNQAQFVKNNPAPVLKISYEGIVLRCNLAAQTIFEKDPTGERINDFLPRLDMIVLQNSKSIEPIQYEQRIGEKTYLFTIRIEEPTKLIYVFGSEITKWKHAEKINTVISKITHAINVSNNLETLLCVIQKQLGKFIDATNFYVALYDKDRGLYSFPFYIDQFDKEDTTAKISLHKSLTDYVRKNNMPLIVDRKAHQELIDKGEVELVGTESQAWMGAPLNTTKGTIGIVAVQSYTESSTYTEQDLDLLSLVSDYIAIAIERKQAEIKLITSDEKFRIISNSAHDAIIMVDNKGITTFWNKAAEKIFGFSESEVIGKNCHDLIMPEKYRDAYEKGMEMFKKTGEGNAIGKTVELTAKRRDGGTFPIEMSISSILIKGKWHAVAIIRNISERIEREEAFSKTVSQYMAMINTIPAMIYLKDIEHNYITANEVFCNFVNKNLHEIIGKTDYDIFPPDKADLHHIDDKKVMDEDRKVFDNEEKIEDTDGKIRWFSTTKVPLHDSQGLVSGVVALTQDVTEKHMSREQLLQADKLAAIGTLAAGVAHEINNPIGFVNSNLNTMGKYLKKVNLLIDENNKQSEEEREDLKDMLTDFQDAIDESIEGTARVKKIVADLKSFSRVDRAEKELVSINEGIESTLNIVWNELKYKCKVVKDLGDIPDLKCKPNQLNQVFMNILVNAGHAITDDSGIITIKTWNDDENIYVSIKDNGIGISQDKIGKIFEPFFTTKEVGKGTGLGLSLVYDIIKKHEGKIDVKSEVGKGSEFIITLPLEGIKDEQTKIHHTHS